jgi:hypothetical protein
MRKYKFKVVDKNEGSCVVHPKSSFYRRYPKDTNVIASIYSLGVMVFHTRDDARNFINMHNQEYCDLYHRAKHWKIKRVLPIGRGKTPKLIASSGLTEDIKLLDKWSSTWIVEIFSSYKGYRRSY